MGQVTDPDLLAILNGGAPPAGPVLGPPPKPTTPPEPKTTYRPLSPQEIAARGLNPQHAYQVGSDGKIDDLGETGKPDNSGNAEAVAKMRRVIDLVDQIGFDATDNGGWFETGATGAMLRSVPGTAAMDIQNNLQTLNSRFAFDALQAMRDASKTGGALGQISDKEEELLRSTVANLNPNQSQANFLENLGSAKFTYLDMLRRLDPQAAAEYENKPGFQRHPDGSTVLTYAPNDKRDVVDPLGIRGAGDPGGGGPGGGGGLSLDDIALGLKQGMGDIVEGAGDVAGVVVNPVGQALYDATGYGNRTYDTGKILRSAAGLPDNPHPLASAINKGAAAALTGAGVARGLATVVQPGVVQGVLSAVGRAPVRDTVAGGTAALGGYAGRASGLPAGEVIGNIVGGVVGYGSAAALAPRVAGVRQIGALGRAAERQRVDLLPADAGGPVAKAITTGTRASPLSVAPVVRAAQRQQGQMRDAVGRIASGEGDVVTTEQAGQSVRAAAQRFTQETSQRASRLYDRAGAAAKGVAIKPVQTLARLEEYIGRLLNDPSAPESAVAELTRFRDNIESGVGVTGLRDARTRLSQGVYDGKLRSGAEQGMWKDILGNLSSDIELGLQHAGRGEAAGMFRRADAFWKDRVEHIDQVLQPILGKDRGGEQVVQAVESMARGQAGGNARLSRLLSRMSPEEAGQVRATLIDRIGRATPGAQNAEGTGFSAGTFLTNWNKMTPQAKGSLFADSALRRNLDDIATLADGMKASQSMANHSNTGAAMYGNVGAQTAFAAFHPVMAIIGAGAQYLTGRVMASPGFARILARSAKLPPEAANRTLSEQLGILASREPAISTELEGLRQVLASGANDNAATVSGAVAGEPDHRQK